MKSFVVSLILWGFASRAFSSGCFGHLLRSPNDVDGGSYSNGSLTDEIPNHAWFTEMFTSGRIVIPIISEKGLEQFEGLVFAFRETNFTGSVRFFTAGTKENILHLVEAGDRLSRPGFTSVSRLLLESYALRSEVEARKSGHGILNWIDESYLSGEDPARFLSLKEWLTNEGVDLSHLRATHY